MTTERIDIEVTDKVAASIPKKLREIADHADRGEKAVDRLKAALAALPSTQLSALSAGAADSSSKLKSLSSAASGLDAKLHGVAAGANEADTAMGRLSASAGAASAQVGKVGAGASNSARQLTTAARGATLYSTSMRNMAGATGLAGHQMGNLTAQLNDIGVSLASGQNPLLVMIQQGSQIQYLASTVEGGFKTLLKATAALVVGQQQVSNAATQQAAANLASANASLADAEAKALQAGIQANLVISEQALTAAKAENTAASARLAAAEAELSLAQARVTATGNSCFGAQQRLAAAKLESAAASQAATIAEAELATAQAGLARSSQAAAAAQANLARASAGTALGLGPLGAILVGLGAVLLPLGAKFQQFHNQLNADNGLQDYVNTLGLTQKELRELEDVTVTYGDMATGVWMTVKEGLAGLGPVFDAIGSVVMGIIDLIWNTLKNFSFGLVALFKGTYRAVITIWNQFPAAFGDLFARAANVAISSLEWIANKAVDVLNYLGGSFESVTLRRMQNANAGAASQMGADLMAGYTDAFNEAEAGFDRFVDRVAQNSQQAARDRLRDQANAIIEDRPEQRARRTRTGRDEAARLAERRAHALAQVNLQLDNELSTMRLLKDERAIQQRMDQITEALAQKRITLTDAEAASIRAKVTEIERFRYVQAEMDRITEEAIGPRRTLNAAIEAANLLLERGAITQERFNQEIAKANRVYNEATDPLFRFNEQLDSAQRLTGLYGEELERANYAESVRQELIARGYEGDALRQKMLSDEVQLLLQRNDALRQQQYIQEQMSAVLDPILSQQREIESQQALYAELERLRQNDLINEEAYERAKLALWMKFNEYKLANTADFFGALANLTKNGHGAVGAISKAAAVAEATIQGYLAVQKALASAPPPFNYAAAAAVAIRTGSNVAGILSTNVGSYATGGQFIVGGRGGVDKNNINMNVTRGERVTIETVKQQRANDNQANGAPTVNANTKVVNLFDEKEFIGAMDSDEGERVVMNIIRRNADGIKGAIER